MQREKETQPHQELLARKASGGQPASQRVRGRSALQWQTRKKKAPPKKRTSRETKSQWQKRLGELLEDWSWERAHTGVFSTPEGILDLTQDGKATVAEIMRRAGVRSLYLQEPRVNDTGSRDLIPGHQPVLGAHRRNKSMVSFDKWKSATLAAIAVSRDGHFVVAQLQDRGCTQEEAAVRTKCTCGVPLPSRQHRT